MPDVLNLGALRSTQGYFLAVDTEHKPFDTVATDSDWCFGATYRDSPTTTLRNQVLALIRNAQQKVFVTSFILGDDDLIEALVDAADRLAGGVYVISELSERSLRQGLSRLAEAKKITQAVEAEKKRFVALTTRGVAVRGHRDCHAKFVVADDRIAWVGTANLETGAFTRVGEVGVVLRDPAEVARLARLFARMWLVGCEYELPSSASTYQVDQRRDRPTDTPFTARPASLGTRGVLWTSTDSDSLRTAIHDVIATATHRLRLATYSLNGMEDRPDLLLDPVAAAIDHGVRVEFLLRAMNWRDHHRHDAALLHRLGVTLVADDANHAKAAIADDHAGLLFSANFDAQHGLDAGSGIEVGVRLDGTPALSHLIAYLDHSTHYATRRFVDQPTAQALHDHLNEAWHTAWPLDATLAIHADATIWNQLAAATTPVLWQRQSTSHLTLIAGVHRLTLNTDQNTLTAAEPGPTAEHFEEASWRGPRTTDERGFCPATFHRTAHARERK
jgi:phosphatidylserine/phosphatidylglycerophosphate/cardiolipin synthase-like enzyme